MSIWDYALPAPADVLLQVEAAMLPDQRVVDDLLTIWSDVPTRSVEGYDHVGRRCWAHGVDRLTVHYRATVEVARAPVILADYAPTSPRLLPRRGDRVSDAQPLLPVRPAGGLRPAALPRGCAAAGWRRRWSTGCGYRSTTASAPARGRRPRWTHSPRGRESAGDYAHLLVALARAGDIPARCVSAYAPGVDPPDFHAVAELWLDGAWRLVDPTGMANCQDLVRVSVGRDATDIAFMTIFGTGSLIDQRVSVSVDRNADDAASF